MSMNETISNVKAQLIEAAGSTIIKRGVILKAAKAAGLEYRATCNAFLRKEMMAGTRGSYDLSIEPEVKTKKTKTALPKVARAMAKKIKEPMPVDVEDVIDDDQDVELTDTLDIDMDSEFADESEMLEEVLG